MKTWIYHRASALLVFVLFANAAIAQSSSLTRAAELRADKLTSSAVILELSAGAAVHVMGLEGGWAHVQVGGKSGWVRAGALNLASSASAASNVNAGREARGNTAMTLGVRSLGGARSTRYALIISINAYANSAIPPLPGVAIDAESARQIAETLQIPATSTSYVQGSAATGEGIRTAIKNLEEKLVEGDRVFIYFSGYGTTALDAGVCAEGWVAHDGAVLLDKEMSALIAPIASKAGKLFLLFDAGHTNQGIGLQQLQNGFKNVNDEGRLRSKSVVAPGASACTLAAANKGRNLLAEKALRRATNQDMVFATTHALGGAAVDDEEKGGLSTQFLRDCLLREAKDLNSSGAITLDEVRQCVQTKMGMRLQGDAVLKAPVFSLTGNIDFVPARFAQPPAAPGLKP